MKTIFILSICMLITINAVLPQCNNNQKIESPVSQKPTAAAIVSVNCNNMIVQWKGNAHQTFELNITVKDAANNQTIKNITTTKYKFNDSDYTAAFPVTPGTKVSWNVQAITRIDDRDVYSYPLRGDKDYLIPNCDSLIANNNANKDNSLSVVGDKNMKVKVYPNPMQSILNIEFSGDGSSRKVINIFDVNGKTVITSQTILGNIQIDVKQLNRGTYFIRIGEASGKVLYNGKVIKE